MLFAINDAKAEIVNKENIPACDLLSNINVVIGGVNEESVNALMLTVSMGFRESHYKACSGDPYKMVQDGSYNMLRVSA